MVLIGLSGRSRWLRDGGRRATEDFGKRRGFLEDGWRVCLDEEGKLKRGE